ncbi:S9 family peptidase [Polaromonas sp.]|uniref:alpha/beta hydrolase family protein n=1 Tax=Polaromonas sp. TaxID=1869339 RepID=UPI00272F57B5|nr:CocE/NonD family hydrolase [Polaromonas sp.]MDP1740714.1 CocE/NonD family hydrolase [Polaromonas sp.]
MNRLITLVCFFWATTAGAQTAWPDYMPGLSAGFSESPMAAVLPEGTTITQPAASLPADKARWSGLWAGWACWAALCNAKIAVERVTDTGATLAYAGSSAQSTINDRGEAQFVNDELVFRVKTGAKLVLRLRPSGEMEFSIWKPDTELITTGLLTQKPVDDHTRTVERVPTPWTENGKPQTLEMVVYRPIGAGPFPTLVMNHGSTGSGDKPERFTSTWTNPDLARVFARKGWLVLYPQRRGRGQSDGLYDEGFELNRSRYSCDPALTLPGMERALADLDVVMAHVLTRSDVDATRLLMGGVSRGGILSSVYAGTRPNPLLGVLNFVGGWVSDRCSQAEAVNAVSFKRAAAFGKPVLWLYGDKDPFYSLRHSRFNFDAFLAAGGKGSFVTYPAPTGQNGHAIHAYPGIWQAAVNDYLQQAVPSR